MRKINFISFMCIHCIFIYNVDKLNIFVYVGSNSGAMYLYFVFGLVNS